MWEEVRLPDDKLPPLGVVSRCLALVEHPDLVAQRIARFAGGVGRKPAITSNEGGFAYSGAGDKVHPLVTWAKLEALVEGEWAVVVWEGEPGAYPGEGAGVAHP